MSIKTEFRAYLEGAEKETISLRETIKNVCTDPAYTTEGKKEKCNAMLEKHKRYLDELKRHIIITVQEKLSAMDQETEKDLAKRNSDLKYQNLLVSNLKILPLIKGGVSYEELKKRLSVFQDDPFAISALKAAISESKDIEKMCYIPCLPEDTRETKKEQLKKLESTLCELLDEMSLRINSSAFEECGTGIERDISKIPIISSTLDYISACNADCTVYDLDRHMNTQKEYMI